MAVTDMSGTTQLDLSEQRARKKVKPSRNKSQTGSYADFFDNKNLLFKRGAAWVFCFSFGQV